MIFGEVNKFDCKITKPELFETKVDSIDSRYLHKKGKNKASGQLYIIAPGGNPRPFYGEFHLDEFEEEFGFVLVWAKENEGTLGLK